MPNARPCRTRRSSKSAASWASLSSSTKNSWNSSTTSRMRGSGRRAGSIPIAVDVLHAGIAEPVGPQPQLGVQPLEDAEAELALALDRHDAGVGQLVGGVDLELDALLEVDQVEVDLVGAVVQSARLVIRACIKVDLPDPVRPAMQDVLRGALTERQVLPLGRAGLAERDVDPGAAVPGPPRLAVGGAMNSKGTSTRLASLAAAPIFWICRVANSGGRRRIEGQRKCGRDPGRPRPARRAVPGQVGTVRAEGRSGREPERHGLGGVGGDQRQHAAGHAAGGDRRQPAGGLLVESWSGKSATTSTR